MAHLKVFGRFLFEYSRIVVKTRQWPNDTLFLQAAYRAFLKRELDEASQSYHLQALQAKHTTWWGVLHSIVQSDEFKLVYPLPAHPLYKLHEVRMKLVQNCLPPAQVILDLGGAGSRGHPEGALLAMGYPHHPAEIIIVDLPPTQRLNGGQGAENSPIFVTKENIHIRYLYRSMSNLSDIASETVDLVFSGESIEHITEAEADLVCQEVYRILRPGGYFCLDTPNAALTRLQSPGAFIHPEHKKEYDVHELQSKLEQWGFAVIESKGLCPMPESFRTRLFSYKEMVHNADLADTPETSYLFFLKAIKPNGNLKVEV